MGSDCFFMSFQSTAVVLKPAGLPAICPFGCQPCILKCRGQCVGTRRRRWQSVLQTSVSMFSRLSLFFVQPRCLIDGSVPCTYTQIQFYDVWQPCEGTKRWYQCLTPIPTPNPDTYVTYLFSALWQLTDLKRMKKKVFVCVLPHFTLCTEAPYLISKKKISCSNSR